MAEETKDAAPPVNLPIIVNAQYMKDLSFENPQPLANFQPQAAPPPKIAGSPCRSE